MTHFRVRITGLVERSVAPCHPLSPCGLPCEGKFIPETRMARGYRAIQRMQLLLQGCLDVE